MEDSWGCWVGKLRALSSEQRLHLFELLAHNLTVAARAAWSDPELSAEDQLDSLKQINECLHRVTSRVWVQRLNTHRWTDEDFISLLSQADAALHPRVRGGIAFAFRQSYAAVAT